MDEEWDSDLSSKAYLLSRPWVIQTLAFAGCFFISLGIWYLWRDSSPDEAEFQIVKHPANSETDNLDLVGELRVDVGGAVKSPGVYELPFDSRIEDALIIAGGVTEKANFNWIEKTLNRAERLKDGAKIYIPYQNESATKESSVLGANVNAYGFSKVSINTANSQELESLWGVGSATADAIMGARPFQRVEDLLEKKLMKQNVWDRNKDKLTL